MYGVCQWIREYFEAKCSRMVFYYFVSNATNPIEICILLNSVENNGFGRSPPVRHESSGQSQERAAEQQGGAQRGTPLPLTRHQRKEGRENVKPRIL